MRALFRDAWQRDRRGILTILVLNIAVSLTGGISIVMLIPMLELLDISSGSAVIPAFILNALQRIGYAQRVSVILAAYMLLILGKAVLNRALTLKSSQFVENHSCEMRERLYNVVSTAPWERLTADKQTDTITLFTSQSSQVSYGVAEIIQLISSVFSAAVQLAIALWLSLPVTALVLVSGGIFIVLFKGMFKKSREYGDELIKVSRAMYSELVNQLWGVKEVRTYGVQPEHAKLFTDISNSTRETKVRYTRLRSKPQMAFSLVSSGLVCIIFVICVLGLKMELGRMMVLVYVFTRLWPVFSGFYSRIQGIQTCIPAFEKLTAAFKSFGSEELPRQSSQEIPFERELTFEHVGFRYEGSSEDVLTDVSFTLKKGTITALVGRNGAGKTTIADLMLGLLQPDSGAIRVDGVELTKERLSAWRKDLAYIPQTPWILNTSVRENLMRFHPQATEAELIEALQKAGAWELISRMPQGMDTALGDQGIRLSGGERQRIVLARMLIGKPRFIVMDEATGAMDFENESAVRRIMRSLCPETTILIIAHRAETIRTAQYAIVLENGSVSEQGELNEIMHQDGSYLSRLLLCD